MGNFGSAADIFGVNAGKINRQDAKDAKKSKQDKVKRTGYCILLKLGVLRVLTVCSLINK